MASPAVPFQVNERQQEAIIKFVVNCVENFSQTWNLRDQFLMRDKIYYREVDQSVEQIRALTANQNGDPFKYQNMTVPIVMPQVESALAALGTIFLTGYPIFGVAADPKNMDTALQFETIIADNTIKYNWIRELIMWMRDALKYNLAFLEVQWKRKHIYSVINDPVSAIKTGGQGTQTELNYAGNCLERWDPYNTIWDKRVLSPVDLPQKGEFIGKTAVLSRVGLKQLFLELDQKMTMNARKAFESGSPTLTLSGSDSWYYIPQVNPNAFIGSEVIPTTNWMAWAMLDGDKGRKGIQYNNIYEVTTMYAKIIPQDFQMAVPARNQPQIWKFIVVNRKVVIYVERMTNAHNLLPVLVCQPNEDGLGYQTKSFLDNATPFQYMGSAMWNASIESKRRMVFDRLFYDPSRIRKEDIDRATSVARIPVKGSAFGKSVQEAVFAFPYRDDNSAQTLQMASEVSRMADEANGQNKVQRGQFQKGNKSKTEFVDTMQASNSRQQMQALGIEHQAMVPLKEMIKINIIQYQEEAEYYNTDSKVAVPVKPQDLRKASLTFKLSDGIMPSEKLMATDILQVFMQTIQTSPLMQAEFDMVGAFTYWCKLQGAQWFEDFRRDDAARNQVMQQLTQYEANKRANAGRPAGQPQLPQGQPAGAASA
jgi:hypothetical protein